MWKSLASNFLTLLIVAFLIVGGVIVWGQKSWVNPGPLAEGVCISVPRGATMTTVSDDLKAKGAISNLTVFRLGVEYTDKSAQLKAGNFLIPAKTSMEEVLRLLTANGQSTCGADVNLRIGVTDAKVQLRELDPATAKFQVTAEFDPDAADKPAEYTDFIKNGFGEVRVTLAEGVTAWQVQQSLNKFDVMTGTIAKTPEEGTLAPGSYTVTRDEDRATLVEQMQQRQQEILAAAWAARKPGIPLASAQQALIMASIIEKETGVDGERPEVASVFENRLDQGMRLQTDPTVIYGLTGGKGVLGRGLRASELRRVTPYNTYVIDGLPPTPIANPGKAAIMAAVQPADTKYLYFVADGTGGHVFAETLDEHNANVRKWRALERQRASQPGSDESGTGTGVSIDEQQSN